MGANMFSNGRKTYVGTSSANVFAEYENPNKQLMFGAIKMGVSVADTFKEAYPLQIAQRSKSLYRKSTETVFKPLSESRSSAIELSESAQQYLQQQVGAPLTYTRIEEDAAHIKASIESVLVSVYGWDADTGIVTNPPAEAPVANLLIKYLVTLKNNSVTFYFKGKGITYNQEYTLVTDLAVGSILYYGSVGLFNNEYVNTNLSYAYGAGNVDLDSTIKSLVLVKEFSTANKYYPVIPFYIDDFEIGSESNSTDPRHTAAKRLLKTIGMNYKETVTHLKESVTAHVGSHKGLYAYILYGVDPMKGVFRQINSVDAVAAYHEGAGSSLYKYYNTTYNSVVSPLFNALHRKDWIISVLGSLYREDYPDEDLTALLNEKAIIEDNLPSLIAETNNNLLTAIQDTNSKLADKYQGSLNYLFEYFLDKSIAPIITTTTSEGGGVSVSTNPHYIQVSDNTFQTMLGMLSVEIKYFTSTNLKVGHVTGEYFSSVLLHGVATNKITYTKQMSTSVSCSVSIYGLHQEFNIHGGYVTRVNLNQGFDVNSSVPTVEGVQLRLPLHRYYADKVKLKLQNELYHHALCFIFNSYQNVKVKWYQNAGWGFVIKVVAIIFALPSGGQSFTWASALTAALKFIVQSVIVKLAIKGLIKLFGIDVTAALILIASAYGYFGKSYDNGFQCVQGLPFADLLLKTSLTMWKTYGSELENMAQDLQKEMDDLDAEMKKQEEELLTAKKLLDTGADNLNPWLFVNPLPEQAFGEYPDQMIDRLLSGIRIPDIVVNAPSNYVDLMLTLPTFDETIRMNTRGK